MSEFYTKAIKINSKRLQDELNDWHLGHKGSSRFQFKTFHDLINLKFPKDTIHAECINNAWYWIVRIEKFEMKKGQFYKIDFSCENSTIGQFNEKNCRNPTCL